MGARTRRLQCGRVVRSATIRCRATVLQRGNSFVQGANVHVHPADLKLPHLKKVSAQAKAIAVDQVFRPARDIVEATVSDTVQDRFVAPKTSNIKRYVNNHRTAFRPKDPHRLGFRDQHGLSPVRRIPESWPPCWRGGRLIFATEYQLNILRQAKKWYIDGTIKIVQSFLKPTGQLMSIHAFVEKDGRSMQFPLLFALMSRRRKEDNTEVFRAVQNRLGNSSVEMVTADFEAVHGRPSAKFSRMHPWRAAPFTGQRLCGAMFNSLAWPPPLDSGKVLTASLSSSWHCYFFHGITLRMSSEWWRNEPQATSSNLCSTSGTSGSKIQFSPSAPGVSTSSPSERTTT